MGQGAAPRGTGPLGASHEACPPPNQVNSQCRLANHIAESLAESAAAYTKATARKCLLEKVEVITGEEAESNVLQVSAHLLVVPGARATRSVSRQITDLKQTFLPAACLAAVTVLSRCAVSSS